MIWPFEPFRALPLVAGNVGNMNEAAVAAVECNNKSWADFG
jgi:hypothetical protein